MVVVMAKDHGRGDGSGDGGSGDGSGDGGSGDGSGGAKWNGWTKARACACGLSRREGLIRAHVVNKINI